MAALESQGLARLARPPVKGGRSAVERALDLLPIGIVFVDSLARVMRHNSFAYAILAENDGLRVDRYGLGADRQSESRALKRLIADVTSRGCDGEDKGEGSMTVSRPSGQPDLWLDVAALARHGAIDDRIEPSAVVLVVDPVHSFPVHPALIQRRLGLTVAEARLGQLLALGQSIDAAASQLGISKNTARVHLQRMFGKTGATRQGQLVRRLLTCSFSLANELIAAPRAAARQIAAAGDPARAIATAGAAPLDAGD